MELIILSIFAAVLWFLGHFVAIVRNFLRAKVDTRPQTLAVAPLPPKSAPAPLIAAAACLRRAPALS